MSRDSSLPSGLEKNYRILVTSLEIKYLSQAIVGYFDWFRNQGVKPPDEHAGACLRVFEKMNKALGKGPDLVTIKNKPI